MNPIQNESILNIFSSVFLLLLLFLLFLLWNEISVIFSDFLLSNEKSGYTENISTIIFFIHILLLSYEPVKVYRIDMEHPVNVSLLILQQINYSTHPNVIKLNETFNLLFIKCIHKFKTSKSYIGRNDCIVQAALA